MCAMIEGTVPCLICGGRSIIQGGIGVHMGRLKQESTKSLASWRNEDVRVATAHKPFVRGTLVSSNGKPVSL